jgi:hypothetical protein
MKKKEEPHGLSLTMYIGGLTSPYSVFLSYQRHKHLITCNGGAVYRIIDYVQIYAQMVLSNVMVSWWQRCCEDARGFVESSMKTSRCLTVFNPWRSITHLTLMYDATIGHEDYYLTKELYCFI